MKIYLNGVSCVGKTTIGKMLADKMGYSFYDIDEEIEKYYQKPIERIQDDCWGMRKFREMGSQVLDIVLSRDENAVIAATPAGLKYSYLQVYKKHKKKGEVISIHIIDKPENIVNRITFYDKDSIPITIVLDELKKKLYLKEIIKDYNHFKDSFQRADLQIDINEINLEDIPDLIISRLDDLNGIAY